MAENDILVSVVIPTYKAADHLRCCIRSLARSSGVLGFEVCIYGDGGGDDSERAITECRQILAEVGIPAVTLYNPQNLGNTPALNAAARLASGKWLLFVNDDMVFPSIWFDKLFPLLLPRRVLSLTCFEPPVFGHKPARCFIAANLGLDPEQFDFEKLDLEAARAQQQSLEEGVNYPFFVERDAFFALGGADERFLAAYHDPDMFLRFKLAGLELTRTKLSPLYHFSGVSIRFADASQLNVKKRSKSEKWIRLENAARILFVKKWGAKPRSRFGEVPKTRAVRPYEHGEHSVAEVLAFQTLLLWEKLRIAWNSGWHKLKRRT